MYTYDIERKWALEAGGKRWLVRFEPRQGEETGSFGFGGWYIWYCKGLYDWEIFVVIISRQRISKGHGRVGNNIHGEPIGAVVEEWILEIYTRGHVRDCQVVDADEELISTAEG
jgi:hypothetical protein